MKKKTICNLLLLLAFQNYLKLPEFIKLEVYCEEASA